MAYSTTTVSMTPSLLGRIGNAFDALANRYNQHKAYRETRDGLNALSDRELSDLGIYRGDIKRLSLEAAGVN